MLRDQEHNAGAIGVITFLDAFSILNYFILIICLLVSGISNMWHLRSKKVNYT